MMTSRMEALVPTTLLTVLAKYNHPWIVKQTSITSQIGLLYVEPNSPAQTSKLPKGMKRTPTPVSGFLTVQLSTSPPWFNLLLEQKNHFDAYPEPKF
ncbi:hypothetical protein C0993_010205 [Termitomyces sp. T159_Od127]|nr:hypothetical protein C0993_010205 [Termitomyces sp. T159_Od127]